MKYSYEDYKQLYVEALGANIDDVKDIQYKDGGWDSVGHMMLITKAEQIFGIELQTEDIVRWNSFGDGIEILRKYDVHITKDF